MPSSPWKTLECACRPHTAPPGLRHWLPQPPSRSVTNDGAPSGPSRAGRPQASCANRRVECRRKSIAEPIPTPTPAARLPFPPARDASRCTVPTAEMAFFGITSKGPQNPFRAATEGEANERGALATRAPTDGDLHWRRPRAGAGSLPKQRDVGWRRTVVVRRACAWCRSYRAPALPAGHVHSAFVTCSARSRAGPGALLKR